MVTLVERGGATEVTMRAVFKTKAQRDEVVERYHAIARTARCCRRDPLATGGVILQYAVRPRDT